MMQFIFAFLAGLALIGLKGFLSKKSRAQSQSIALRDPDDARQRDAVVDYLDRSGLRLTILGDIFVSERIKLGSGLIDHIQKMTIAAIAMADMKVCAQRS
jgi:hypothetical protein